MSTYDFTDEGYSVFKVNLKTAKFEKAVNNVNDIDYWYADRKGRVRVGVAVEKKDDKINRTIWYRAAEQDELKKLHTRTYGVGETFYLIGLNDQGDKAYVLSDRETGFQSLWLYDIPKGEFEQMLFTHPQYDLEDGLFDSQGELIGAYYYDDYYRSYYFDPADGEQENTISAVLKGQEVTVVSRSADKTKLLAMAVRDDKVPTYFYFDLAKKKGGIWLSQYPQLAKSAMHAVEPYQFEASDGLKISGYLTMPVGVEDPAVIVYPHGGPHARDYRYFDPKVQLLAAKGYAVLQVNFRGSEGFGTAFETAGYYQWGKRMQQDVYEAMDWLLASDRVSKTKACIVGASYGGYVALTAAYQHPERFDCVVSVSGVSDLEELVQDEERQDSFIGNIVDITDKNAIDELADVSAINYLDKIKSPMLLIHGTKDTRVNYDQSRSFYSKAKSRLDIKYIEIKDGTHFFDDYESNLTFIRELDSFLTKHL
ncbi:alpha/beta fold hydrolase [Bowmanella sp. Y26]|nr:alpha/beta fold hydrolase [Bowmanella yangjiangensis]